MIKKRIIKILSTILLIVSVVALLFSLSASKADDVNIITRGSVEDNVSTFIINKEMNTNEVYFYSNAQKISIYLNSKLIQQINSKSTNRTIHSFEIPDDMEKEGLLVEIHVENICGILNDIERLFIGNQSELLAYLLQKDSIKIVFCFIIVALAILVTILITIVQVFDRKSVMITSFSLLFLIASFWCLLQVDFIIYYLNNEIITLLQNFLIPLLLLPGAFLINYFNKDKIMKNASITITSISFAIILISIILYCFNINIIEITKAITIMLTLIYLITVIVFSTTQKEEKNKFINLFIQAIIIWTIGVLFELIISLISPNNEIRGLFLAICITITFVLTIGGVIKEYLSRDSFRTYLSEENAKLSQAILLSQIKPHFLYNALNSISLLCKKDPKQADMAVIRFSRYLRQNMKCIESSELVDFNSEMEHIKNYLYLELLRFPKMEIIYELKFIDFVVPPLCIQPLVENAVKHGVSKNVNGGYIIIKSFATAKHIIIEINDNGPGYDTNLHKKGTGLSNISRRLSMLIDADIDFASIIGKGTIVRVKIPRKDV